MSEPDERQLIIHHDLGSWNFVHGAGRNVFIDWDLAGPGSALWDLAFSAHSFAGVGTSWSLELVGQRLCELVDGYDLDETDRIKLIELLPRRYQAMYDVLKRGHERGTQPWARMWREGHGAVWERITAAAAEHSQVLQDALLR